MDLIDKYVEDNALRFNYVETNKNIKFVKFKGCVIEYIIWCDDYYIFLYKCNNVLYILDDIIKYIKMNNKIIIYNIGNEMHYDFIIHDNLDSIIKRGNNRIICYVYKNKIIKEYTNKSDEQNIIQRFNVYYMNREKIFNLLYKLNKIKYVYIKTINYYKNLEIDKLFIFNFKNFIF